MLQIVNIVTDLVNFIVYFFNVFNKPLSCVAQFTNLKQQEVRIKRWP